MMKKMKEIFGNHHGLDERSVEFLTKALAKNNLPGFDYLEFKQSLHALSGMELDEATSYKSTFATASTMGLTKDKLLKTATHYKQILHHEKEQFGAALAKQVTQKVESKLAEVEKLKKQVADYQAKIQQLEEKITKAKAVIAGADETIQTARGKIDETRKNFEFTLQSIVNEIDQDIENINHFL